MHAITAESLTAKTGVIPPVQNLRPVLAILRSLLRDQVLEKSVAELRTHGRLNLAIEMVGDNVRVVVDPDQLLLKLPMLPQRPIREMLLSDTEIGVTVKSFPDFSIPVES